jgi:hypothetical protein
MTRMLPVLAFALLAAVPARSQDERGKTDYLDVARLAMEAQIKIGDTLRQKGDLDGAMEAYRQAIALFEEAKRRSEPVRVVKRAEPKKVVADEPFSGPARSAAPDNAVTLGLEWLAAHQQRDGQWDCDAHGGGAVYDTGVTALAVLAFLGAGHTDRGDGAFAGNVRRGLRYLLMVQDDEGCFGARVSQNFIYAHALSTLAVTEAYATTKNPRYREPAQRGLDFIARARNPYMAWRYGVRTGENDTSVTICCVMALKSGQKAGFKVDPDAFKGALAWIDKMTDPDFGRVGYNMRGGAVARAQGLQDKFPAEKSQAMTAAGVLGRILCGEDPKSSAMIQKGVGLMLEHRPWWDTEAGTIDMYYWYLGTLAMFQVGGNAWRKWGENVDQAIVERQHRGEGANAGSWDPAGAWGPTGGRVYSTALMTMCLEVFYRYDKAVKR